MLYPTDLISERANKDFIDLFGGYNHNVRIKDNEFFDMQNLTSNNYPTLSPRVKRGTTTINTGNLKNARGILYKSNFYHVICYRPQENTIISLYKDGALFAEFNSKIDADVERQLVMMGAYIIVLPDKVYFNTVDNEDCGKIEASYLSKTQTKTVLPCDIDGNVYEINGVSSTVPEDAWDGYIWLDTNESPAMLKRFTTTNATWSPIPFTNVRVSSDGISRGFAVGDGVEISGFTSSDLQKLNGSTIIQSVIDEDNIIIKGLLDTVQNKFTFRVKDGKEVTENAPIITAYCNSELAENELANKKLVINNKLYECISNTAPQLSLEKDIDLEDENKWLGTNSPTLKISEDVVDGTIIILKSTDLETTGINENNLTPNTIVRIGATGEYVYISGLRGGNQGEAQKLLILNKPITAKAGTLIYPVKGYQSESLYTTNITLNTFGRVNSNDGACVSLESIFSQTDAISMSRKMPELDFVIESNNRLWGCKYGEDANGNFVNQIYASALGDFKNWSVFEGTSADSYFASVGTSGKFTGAVNYLGYPTFFKEDCMHTIYGAFPAQYQINTMICRGVQEGSHKSLATVNEVLYYKSIDGVMSYSGSLPTCISYQFGNVSYSNAIACGYKNKYYISLYDSFDNEVLFIYDTNYGVWYKENGINPRFIVALKDDIYYLTLDFELKSMFGKGEADAEQVEWFAESGVFGHDYINKKYITRINVRMSLELGSLVEFYIQYNSTGEWKRVGAFVGNRLNSFDIPIRPMRCDHFRIRIVGKGDAKIFSISKTIEQGSEL